MNHRHVVAIATFSVAFGQQVPTLDEGLLDPAWFGGGAAIEFRSSSQIDYLWVKPGFELRGKRVYFAAWPAPVLPATRDERDAEAAAKFTVEFPPLLREALTTELEPAIVVVDTQAEAEVVLAGRVADCNAGRVAAFVWPATTIDVKVLDATTGELLAAFHNRKTGRPQQSQHVAVLLKLSSKGFQSVFSSAKPAVQ